ncbi:MAG TPA: thiamine pyrophosphate-binding protein, partial [Actinomycetota bacterium]|nr:thiamine pyrophosphate-binding protein [Actinomycetota bacterium]
QIIRGLQAAGVDTVFGLPGVHALGLWKALETSGMRYLGFRHEQAAAHAADGYARASRKPAALFLSTGPGALNSLSALGEAYVSSSPVIAISSAIPSKYFGKGKGYLHEAKDLGPAFAAVTKASVRVLNASELIQGLTHVLREAIGGRRRPVFLEVAADVFDADGEGDVDLSAETPRSVRQDEIDQAALLLRLAARPVIWAGGGVLASGASEALTRIAEKIDAPVVTTFMGKGTVPEDHPLCAGTMVRQPEGQELLREADLLLAVGTRFSAMATGNWKMQLPSQLVHIDIDREELGRNYPVRLGIAADARSCLEKIDAALEMDEPASKPEWGSSAAQRVRAASFERARSEGPREMEMLDAVRAAVPPEIHTVHDMTIASYWSAPFLEVTQPGTFHYPYGYASLGFSLPASIGVAVATGRPVVSFSGDGGLQYHDRELSTIAQYNLPVVALVFNDRAWGILKSFSKARYSTTFGLDLRGPDFVALAESHGVPATVAHTPEELGAAVSKAVESNGPYLVEIPGEWRPPPPQSYYT